MGKDTKIVFFQILDGNEEQIKTLVLALKDIKDRNDLDMEKDSALIAGSINNVNSFLIII